LSHPRHTKPTADAALAATLLLAPVAGVAADPAPALLPAIHVSAEAEAPSLTIPDVQAARDQLRATPGNVSIVDSTAYRDGAVMSLHDALSRTPGVYVQNPAGQETVKLSIRGSGLSTAFATRGVRLLRDGVPLSRADGYADTSWADPFNADYIEVYRGANALQYGASTLGGAINLVSPTGYSQPGVQARLEAGANRYLRTQLRGGRAFDNGVDAFASVTQLHTDGSREHAGQSLTRFYGNLGYRFSPVSEGRLHLSVERNRQQFPGAISLAQLQSDPHAAGASSERADERVTIWPQTVLAYTHALDLGRAGKLALGVHYGHTRFDNPNTYLRLTSDSHDYGISLRHDLDGTLGGRRNRFVWGVNLDWGRSHNRGFGPVHLNDVLVEPSDAQFQDIGGRRSTAELFVENSHYLTPDVALVTGAQAVRARRTGAIDIVAEPTYFPIFTPSSGAATYSGVSPKLGLVWTLRPEAQLFANLSRSYEPPTSVEFQNAAGILQAQRATTLELGTRGGSARFGWDLALYYSRVRNELLGIESPPNSGRYVVTNIDDTRHAGLEAGLHGSLPLPGLPGALDWNLAYTFSRYRIANTPAFDGNALPGIPPHFGRVDFTYRHPSGFYLGPSFEFASRWYVDQANTLSAPGYAIVNATLGYAAPGGKYLVFLDVRNIADKRYAATTDYIVDAGGSDAAVFNPGLARSVFAGVQLRW